MRQLDQHRLESFRRGESSGVEAVYDAYGDAMYRVCYRLCGNRSEAEDLVQETFVAAFRSRASFHGRSSFGTWIYGIALNCCRAHHRRKQPQTVPVERITIEEAIDGLPIIYRESILLVKVEGLLYREAADVLGLPMVTVQQRVFRGMQKLRELCGVGPEVGA